MIPNKKKILTAFAILFGIIPLFAGDNAPQGLKLGLNYGVLNFQSDISPENIGNYGEGSVTLPVSNKFSIMLAGGYGAQQFIPTNDLITTNLISCDVRGIIQLPKRALFTPKLYLGASIINFKRGNWPAYWDGAGLAGGGFDVGLSKRLSLSLTADYRFTSGDDFDGVAKGGKDSYLIAKAGIEYSLPRKEAPKSHLLARTLEYRGQEDQHRGNLPNWTSPSEASASGNVVTREISVIPDTALTSRIRQLSQQIDSREQTIQEVKTRLQTLDEQISSLQTALQQKSQQNTLSADDFYAEYKVGVQKYNERDYSAAETIFKSLMAQDPTNRLASNCQYWIGECEFATQNYENAVDAFQRTLEYSNSTKIDDALIMLGMSFEKINQRDVAKQYFEKLLTEYPESEYSGFAKKSIASL